MKKTSLFALIVALATSSFAAVDDSLYPAVSSAKTTIEMDGRGFTINARRTFISSGSVHYPRVPHELWRDRLLRVQRGGFNTVETYAFWNFHEPRENEFDFTGDKDFGAFLDTAQQVGLYAITRVGPYVCAEWDSGGYPLWLKFKPPFNLRTDDPAFLALNDHWYGKILPLVAAHQVNHGGNVILVQLENEHPKGWGVVHSPYFDHLQESAVRLGIEVPSFMSGLNHGSNPSPANPDTAKRTTPWFTTEFWSGWFNNYGPLTTKRLDEVESSQWRILARGGAGYNFYMLHGGSNFETWNDPSGAASYDYGAAIGQAGDLRPVYYRMKRANQFAQSFPDILANGSDSSSDSAYQDFVSGAKVLGVRTSPAGTVVFLKSAAGGTVTFKDGTRLHSANNETFGLPRDATLAAGLKIANSTTRVLGVARHGQTLTVVVHGQPGDSGALTFASAETFQPAGTSKAFVATTPPGQLKLDITTPEAGPQEATFKVGSLVLRIVAVSSDLGLYTWFIGEPGRQYVVCGPNYISDLNFGSDGKPTVVIERPYGTPSCNRVVVYGPAEPAAHLAVTANLDLDTLPAPVLSDWTTAVSPESAVSFDDTTWKSSTEPLQMGADGDTSAFAWYRSKVTAAVTGLATLHFSGKDRLLVFVNGVPAVQTSHQKDQWDFTAPVTAGVNTLAVFTAHAGRNKAFNYLGQLDGFDRKGLYDAAKLTVGGQSIAITDWRMRGGMNLQDPALSWKRPANSGKTPVFAKAGFLLAPPEKLGAHPILRADFSRLSYGTMWLNGHNLGRYPETIPIKGIYLPECWLKKGRNELVVLDETGADATAINLVVETAASREVILVSEPADPTIPINVPTQTKKKNLDALNKTNLAYKHPATASASEGGHEANAATDGDSDTPWTAPSAKPGFWLQVDLGATIPFQTCEIEWEQPAKHYEYTVEGSPDGQNWTKLGDQTTAIPSSPDSPSLLSRLRISGAQARYVRVTITGGLQQNRWASIRELRILNE